MGWFVSSRGFVAVDDAPSVFLYPPLGYPLAGSGRETVSGSAIAEIRQRDFAACELGPTDRLTAYEVSGDHDSSRTLYTTSKYKGQSRSGLVSTPLTPLDLTNLNRLLGWPDTGTLRRDEAIGVRPGSAFYSIHKLYKPDTGLLSEEAIVLHGANGKILGHKIVRGIDQGQSCDGCGIANYRYSWRANYIPLNMFELSGFAYPLVLLDTSTVEGQALTLFTFTPQAKPASFRIYEYVVHCR
jgi:hypothetical protein